MGYIKFVLGIIGIGAIGFSLWHFSTRNKGIAFFTASLGITVIGSLIKRYEFTFENIAGYTLGIMFIGVIIKAYIHVAMDYGDRDYAAALKYYNELDGKKELTEQERKKKAWLKKEILVHEKRKSQH